MNLCSAKWRARKGLGRAALALTAVAAIGISAGVLVSIVVPSLSAERPLPPDVDSARTAIAMAAHADIDDVGEPTCSARPSRAFGSVFICSALVGGDSISAALVEFDGRYVHVSR
jgi:hypothetical protein